ncbi:ATP-binding cassette transporter, partial [Penicillium taxi]|uniref:ATP-binding cassette transporter n=1 Tax=Penicillium taxi TaxID=168475 RepID=UPI0025451CF4
MAVSTAVYKNRINRLQVMTRGAVIGLLHHQSLNISRDPEDSEVLTLMETDVDSIISTGEIFHEIWAQILEVVIGTTMLAVRVHWLALLPLIAIYGIGCSHMSRFVAQHLQSKQKDWNVATQKRIATITSALAGIKSLKMLGMQEAIEHQISDLRTQELCLSEKLRWINVAYNASGKNNPKMKSLHRSKHLTKGLKMLIANALGIFAPVLTLILYSFSLKDNTLQANEVFTSVALLAMVTHPANMVMTLVPRAIAVTANFSRVQAYLSKPPVEDLRNSSHQPLLLDNLSIKLVSRGEPILKNISLDARQGDLVVCAGAVGSGKTILALALLGEIPTTTGAISVSSREIAYCAQNPWLPNVTVRDAISGRSSGLDWKWYNTVIAACGLVPDLDTFSDGDLTRIDNNGMNLSGGQKHRIALARAVYSRNRVMILDDPFSALDQNVTNQIAESLFGPKGILKQISSTVFLITNWTKIFPLADKLVLISDMKVKRQDPTDVKQSQLEHPSALISPEIYPDENPLKSTKPKEMGKSYRMNDAMDDLSRKSGDTNLYWFYLVAVGRLNAFLILGFTATYSFFLTFSQYLLKWAIESSPKDLWLYMSLYAAVSVIAWAATSGTMWSTQIKIAIRSGAILHAQLLQKVLGAPLAYFTETDIGVTLNRFGPDINLIDKQLPPALANLSTQIFKLLAQVMTILSVHPMIIITIPFCSICVYFVQRIYLRASRQLRFLDLDSRSQLYVNFLDSVNGAITIRSFGWKKDFKSQNTSALDLSQKPFYLLLSLQCWLSVTLDCLITIVAVGLVALTVIYKNTTTGADIGLALNLIIVANSTLLKLVESWTSLETSLGAISRLKSVQDYVPSEDRPFSTITPGQHWPFSGSLRLNNVSVFYPHSSEPALEKLSLEVKEGQNVIIMGRTGSGKSTLILSLLQLLDAREGSIRVDEVDLAMISLPVVRQRGFIAVPQDGFNIPTVSLRFNLDPEYVSSESSIIKALKQTRLWHKISTSAMGKLQMNPDTNDEFQHILDCPMSIFLPLSAGEVQLFALCRTLIRVWASPLTKPIIILDEASSSLDSMAESVLCEILRHDLRSHTVVIIAHRVEGIMKAMRAGVDLVA